MRKIEIPATVKPIWDPTTAPDLDNKLLFRFDTYKGRRLILGDWWITSCTLHHKGEPVQLKPLQHHLVYLLAANYPRRLCAMALKMRFINGGIAAESTVCENLRQAAEALIAQGLFFSIHLKRGRNGGYRWVDQRDWQAYERLLPQ